MDSNLTCLLITPDPELRFRLSLYLDMTFHANVLSTWTYEEALQLLRQRRDADLAICDHELEGRTSEALFQDLGGPSDFPFVLLSPVPSSSLPSLSRARAAGIMVRPFEFERLTDLVRWTLVREGNRLPESEYCRIPLHLAVHARTDLFVRLAPYRFVMALKADDGVTAQDLDRFSAKKIEHLYVRREDASAVLNRLTDEVRARLPSLNPSTEADAALGISREAHEAIHALSLRLGLTPEIQQLARVAVAAALKAAEKSPKVASLLQRLRVDPKNYISSHSVVLAHMACGIASLVEWEAEGALEKLALAAFMHDLTLDNQKLASFQRMIDLATQSDAFSRQELALFRGHPEAGAALARQMAAMPPGLDQIILQHHERPDGKGFPRGMLAAQIAPLAGLFILAHDLVDQIFDHGVVGLDEFIQRYKERRASGPFRRILEALDAYRKGLGAG